MPAATAESRPVHDLTPSNPIGVVLLIDDQQVSAAALNRLALAAGAMIPSRPPRIVFGVWRN